MTKLDAPWLIDPAVKAVTNMLSQAGFQVYFVGGCVRNALLGAPASDIDLATDATPDLVMKLAKDAGLNPVPTGIDHGTITVVSSGVPIEVTTFRKDVETDGRRAVVAFSDNIEEDAARRDFTMNALYADPDGQVIDPLGGLPDLNARTVRFINDAEARIQEDYLRILRFFRFHAWYGDVSGGLDPDGVAAVAANLGGLDTLSRERVGHEVVKLLAAPDPAPSVAAMQITGVLTNILPGADAGTLPVLVHLEDANNVGPSAMRRLAALGLVEDLQNKLRLSRKDVKHLTLLMREAYQEQKSPSELAYRYKAEMARDVILLRCALNAQDLPTDLESELARGETVTFPIVAADFFNSLSGPALGKRLKKAEADWIASDFTLTREELL